VKRTHVMTCSPTPTCAPVPGLRQLTFSLERVQDPLSPPPLLPSDAAAGTATASLHAAAAATALTASGYPPTPPSSSSPEVVVHVRLKQGWPMLLGRDDLCPDALSISRRHIVLAFTGERLYLLRLSMNVMRLHRAGGGGGGTCNQSTGYQRERTEFRVYCVSSRGSKFYSNGG
jgi:hypothetical protein